MKVMRALQYALVAVIILTTLAACAAPAAPAPAPTAAPKAAAAEPTKAPEATKAPEPTKAPAPTAAPAATKAPEPTKAPAAAALKAPIPYPDPPKIEVGAEPVKRQKISEIVTYKALPEYKEPAWVTDLVKAGKLPAIKDRLPKEPRVILKSGMADGVGAYGDVGRFFSACPTAGWNTMAGTSAGWFGIESYTNRYDSLVRMGPLWRTDTDVEPLPQLAKSWEWSADGKQLTMKLMEGVKWSDGVPFNADDVMFTWEDMVSDPNVNAPRKADAFKYGGQAAKLEKIDDYTIRWTFGAAKPPSALFNMAESRMDIMPAHILKPMHPKYNKDVDYKKFANFPTPQDLPQVTTGPFAATEYKTDELLILRRNPYFYAVDETGQQLPYLDEIQYQKGPSGTGRTLCVMAGGCDQDNLENPSVFVEALKKASEPNSPNKITWGPETLAYGVEINQSADMGAKDDRDKAVRQLFRDVKFRRALSHATDRDGITQAIMRGPFLRAWPGGIYPGSPEFDQKSAVYYPYDVDSAKALLAELGFKDTDNNGILNWTTGPLAGQDLILSLRASQDAIETVNIGEALVNQWGKAGIKINLRPTSSQTSTDQNNSGEWDMNVFRGGQAMALPFFYCSELAPLTKTAPNFHREGDKPRQLQPFEEELNKIVTQYCAELDPAKRKALMSQYNKIWTENLYNIGVLIGRYGENLTKRFKNVNPGLPAFLYQWTEDAIMLEQVWSPADQQQKQVRPNTVPTYPGSAIYKAIGK